MLAVAHDARLEQRSNPKDPQSLTRRQDWEQLRDAARAKHTIDVTAERALTAPPFPEWMRYLWDAHHLLRNRSGAGADGPAPLSLETFTHARTNLGLHFEPAEVELLLQLDTIRRHPEALTIERTDTATDEPAPARRHKLRADGTHPLWPSSRGRAKAVS